MNCVSLLCYSHIRINVNRLVIDLSTTKLQRRGGEHNVRMES